MEYTIFSMREIQRSYRKILEEARKRRKPVFLGSHGKAQAVLMDIDSFEEIQEKRGRQKSLQEWKRLEKTLENLAAKGRQDVSLSEFVIRDRHAH